MVQCPQQRERIAVRPHPIQIRIAKADRHRRLRQPRHVPLSAKRRGNRPDRAHPPVFPVRAHPRLLDVNDVRPDRLQHVPAQPQPLQHAGRETLGYDIAHPHQVLGNRQPLGMADIQRNAALAGILVVELPAHVEVFHPRQRPRRGIARRPSADRRHRRQARVGIVLPLHLVAFRAHRGQEPGPTRRGQEPREIQDLHALQRERLVMQRRTPSTRVAAQDGGNEGRACRFRQDRLGILPQQRCAPADLPAGPRGQPLAGGITERPPVFRMIHIGKGPPGQPVRIQRVFVRLADRGPQQAGLLRLQPGHVLVGPGAHKPLHHIQHMRPSLVGRCRSRDGSGFQVHVGAGRLQVRFHPVLGQ